MKTIAARDAKNHFGTLIDDARAEPILVERNGRRAAIVLAPEKYDELVAAQDALWEARAAEIVAQGQFLSAEEGVKALETFVAQA
jgi:prevent-host-death family protein